jgi:hypothetical protein
MPLPISHLGRTIFVAIAVNWTLDGEPETLNRMRFADAWLRDRGEVIAALV